MATAVAKPKGKAEQLLAAAAAVEQQNARLAAPASHTADAVFGAFGTPQNPARTPHATTGPVLRDSQGFRLCKAIAANRGLIAPENAKAEIDACKRFEKALTDTRQDPQVREHGSFFVPLSLDLLSEETSRHEDARYMKAFWAAGTSDHDPDESKWLADRITKSFDPGTPVYKAAMSYLQDNIGGTLIAPPVQGELIELVRPKECLMAAGARQVALPPNGRMVFPRQTGPTTFYWIGENSSLTESNPTTGQVVLQAKKGGVLVTLPNELLKYASASADALVRSDVAKTIALGIDHAGLYGAGGASQPKGLTLYSGSNEVIAYHSASPAPKGIGTNGNTLRPEDGYRMIGLLEDRNFEFGSWIFRPTMANNIMGFRGDAAAPADASGGFVQSFMRSVADRMGGENWVGQKVVKSAVVKNTLSKGSSSTLTEVFGGQWEHLMVGMYGAVEFASSNQAGNTFAQDQTQVRALVHTDIVPRYEGAFVWYSFLNNTMN